MNVINMVGNLTADVELKSAQSGTTYCNFNIGVQRPYKDKQTGNYESDFPRCKAFGKTAEIIADHFQRGSKIALTGTLQTGKYTDKDGKDIFTTDVLVNQVTFVERKNQNHQSNNSYQNSYGNQSRGQGSQQSAQNYANQALGNNSNSQPVENPFANSNGDMDISDDDLPF